MEKLARSAKRLDSVGVHVERLPAPRRRVGPLPGRKGGAPGFVTWGGKVHDEIFAEARAPVVIDAVIRPAEPRATTWQHRAFEPLPTEGFLAMRAATMAHRQGYR